MRETILWLLAASVPMAASTATDVAAPVADPMVRQISVLTTERAGMSGMCREGAHRMLVTSVDLSALVVVDLRSGAVLRRIPMPAHLQDCEATRDGFVVTAHDALPDTSGPSPAPGVPPNRFHGPAGTQVILLDREFHVVRIFRGDDTAFFNGIAKVRDFYLIGDTIGGRLWKLDLKHGRLAPWLADPLAQGVGGPGFFGGANGVHAFRDQVYFGSRDAIYRVGIDGAGNPGGTVQLFASIFHADDFDFGADGMLYIPTGTALMRVDPKGTVTKFAELGAHAPTAMVEPGGKAVLVVVSGGAHGETRLLRVPIAHR